MPLRPRSVVVGLALLALVVSAALYARRVARSRGGGAPLAVKALRYMAVGGGNGPESTEVSLEQDMILLEESLPGPGVRLFAGGRGTRSVRLEDPALGGVPPPLLTRLGDLFQPRVGRSSRYREAALVAGPADRDQFERELARALSHGRDPLLLYVSAHGLQGETPRDNSFTLWGGDDMSVSRLAELTEDVPRPLRVVVAACFSGGFAELAFRGADETAGGTQAARCGLFAGAWDRETSGCDPNPERRQQEGYSLHFLHALRGQDRSGALLPAGELDLDGDGRVSLLEAHTRVRIQARSLDIPTTTSERYLRSLQLEAGTELPGLAEFSEEWAVVAALGGELGLTEANAVAQRVQELDAALVQGDAELRELETQEERLYRALATRLLERWPLLDDPYHPGFAAAFQREAVQVERYLQTAPEARQHGEARAALDRADAAYVALQVRHSRVLRLQRAHQTLGMAAALGRRGGPEWDHYRRLLACERGAP